MTTYFFPGQGSQFQGMGESLFNEFPVYVEKANEILGYSVPNLCRENPNGQLYLTQFTQPVLYVVNALSYLKKIQDTSKKPSFLAGHSLGEYNALLAADVFDFETGLKLVQKRGELMSHVSGGGMAAVIGLRSDEVQTTLEQTDIEGLTIANYNSYTQVVIAGFKNSITASQTIFETKGTLFFPLNVSGAFHSPYMRDVQAEFNDFLKQFSFHPATIPVIANINAKPYQLYETQTYLTQQIANPVQWTATMEYLLQQGETDFVEIGPGTVLTGITRRILNRQ